ncbi:hypothetical protein V500_04922 [Pseudogymnoascus sp. VKM F-4518 (FW-2643)]|nr:hypothetical protein V500_04922 [Pseudogymnoascus sp. VKM F-4518 (FW-2643)]
MSTERLKALTAQLVKPGESPLDAITQKSPDDVVVTLALRTPLTKSLKGGFKDTPLDVVVVKLLKHVVQKMNIDPALVEDVCMGNVNEGRAAYFIRAATLAAGFPNTTAAYATNRFCASGLKSIQEIAYQISMGSISCGIAVGAESMSFGSDRFDEPFSYEVLENKEARDCMQSMGQTSENVGRDFNVSREQQDLYACESYKRAEAAQKNGWFDDEIVPIVIQVKDPKTGKETAVTLTTDEGPRWGTTYEALSKIRPAFKQFGGRSTGGNSSQVTDGAAAVLLMKRSMAEKLGQPILAKFVGATVQGLAPRIMGIGPSVAIPKLLTKFNLKIEDIDVIELNEAFASMAVYCVNKLGIDHPKMNVRGGAIALGHPLGATGVRQVVTGLSECRRQKKKILLTSMCIGTGQGMAGLFVNEQI